MTAVNEHTVNGFREKTARRRKAKSKREGAKRPSASRIWEQYAQEGAIPECRELITRREQPIRATQASARSASEAERKIPPAEKYVPPVPA